MSSSSNNTKKIQNIAVVGASGNIGSHIVSALLAKNRFNITAISRIESKASFPSNISHAKIDYDNSPSIVHALEGQDALIITLSVFSPKDTQEKLIRAAADAGVPWVLPNEFGMYNSEEAQNDTIGPGKTKARELIQSVGVSSWVGVTCGFWYEHSLSGPGFYGFDIAKREAVFFDDGTQKINTSTLPQVGRAVAALMSLPISKDGGEDKACYLSNYRNRMAYVSSFAVNQRQMFESIKRVSGTADKDWTITSVSAETRYNEAKEKMKGGDRDAFGKVLYTRYFFPGENAGLFEASHGLENEVLGLPNENLDEATNAAIDLGEIGYWNSYGKH